MMQWLRRLFYLFLVALWLAVMAFPVVAFTLARNGQIMIGERRVFLVQEVDAGGVGVQWSRPARGEEACTQSLVRYVMWEGSAENNLTCSCTDGNERIADGPRCVVP